MTRRSIYFAAIIILFFSLAGPCLAACGSSWYGCVGGHSNSCSDDLWFYTQSCGGYNDKGQCLSCLTNQVLSQDCFEWEQCSSGAAKCQCCGDCFGTPKNPRYYDNPTYSDQPDKSQNSQSIDLPLKLDWDDVLGWKDGWTQNGNKQSCSRNCANSYRLTIYDTKAKKEVINKVLTKSEYNIREDKGPCFLESSRTYEWHVQACCDSNGTTCGPASNWSFTTSLAPELDSPYDPDWAGPEKIENVDLPVSLKWCKINETNSHDIRFFLVKNGVEQCHPSLLNGTECTTYPFNLKTQTNSEITVFQDTDLNFFTKSSEYRWEISSCKGYVNSECELFGQKWSFSTKDTNLIAASGYLPSNDPTGATPIGLPVDFSWVKTPGANSYIFELNPVNIKKTLNSTGLQIDSPSLQLTSSYNWRVKPCWDFEGKDCEDFSQTYYFTTTGLPPVNINVDAVSFPVEIDWGNVSGASSYYYQLASDAGFQNIIEGKDASQNKISFDYTKIKQETDYWFRLKTCAHQNGELCGDWSQTKNFKTIKLASPANIKPQNGSVLSTSQAQTFSWNPVPAAKYYKYSLKYAEMAAEETNEKCPALLNQLQEKITANTNAIEIMDCKGKYQLQAQACMEADCKAETSGSWSAVQEFSIKSGVASKDLQGKGFIPCGLSADDPTTPWDESQRCEIKHLFILLNMIINFLMWTLVPIVLLFLMLASGAIFYFSMGREDPLPRIKSLWKAAGIGLGIIFLSWFIINISLSLVGFKFGAFGKWWNF
ncbi:MAG: pilin [Candidatus Paceibacterota bacterium]|jgi:hypothetical protein